MGELVSMLKAYRQFDINPSYTSVNNIRKGKYKDWLALAQNTSKDSTFARMARIGMDVIHFIKSGRYYAFKLKGTIFINGDFVVQFTSLADGVSDYNTLLMKVFNHYRNDVVRVAGVDIKYAYDVDDVVVAVEWEGTRHHSGLNYKKFVK